MDRQEYNILKESIVELIENKEFAEAADIADTIDWRKVRSFSMLQKISNLYKVNCRLEEAKDLMLLAYNYNPTSKQIVYALSELSIELDDIADALKYLALFRKISPQDSDAYILQYKIMEKNEVKLEDRIELLEEYCKKEKKEEWIYQLAYLYHRIGFATKCVETCDQLILWYKEGPFVIKAMELKMLHTKLSQTQQDLYDHKDDELVEEMEAYESEEYEPYDPESSFFPEMGIEDFHVKTIDMGKFNTSNLQKELAESMREILGEDYNDGASMDPSTTDEIVQPIVGEEEAGKKEEKKEETAPEKSEAADKQVQETEENPETEEYEEIPEEELVEFVEATEETILPLEEKGVLEASTKVVGSIDELEELTEEETEVAEEEPAPKSLQEIIAEKKQSFTKPSEDVLYEELPISRHASVVIRDVELPRADVSVGRSDLEEIMSVEDNGQISLVLPKEDPVVERQITGQLDIEEIMTQWDTLLLRKEEEHRESIKESILRRTGKIFDDYEEATKNSLLNQIEEESKAKKRVLSGSVELRKVEEVQNLDEGLEEVLSFATEDAAVEEVSQIEEVKEETAENASVEVEEGLVVETEETAQKEETTEEAPLEEAAVSSEEVPVKKDPLAVLTEKTLPSIWDEVDKSIAEDEALAAAKLAGEVEIIVDETVEDTVAAAVETTVSSAELEIQMQEESEAKETSKEEIAPEEAEEVIEELSPEEYEEFEEYDGEFEPYEGDEEEFAEEIAELEAALGLEDDFSDEDMEASEEAEDSEESEDEDTEEAEESEDDEEAESLEDTAAETEEASEESETVEGQKTATLNTSTMNDISTALEQQADEVSAETNREMNDLPDAEDERELSAGEMELFSDFLYSNKMKKQILDAVEQISLASFVGNVIITGDNPASAINLAKAMIKEVQLNDANFVSQRIAKISGDKLNRKDIPGTFAQLSSGALIVEKAGLLTKDTLSTITRTLESFEGGIIILLLDTVKSIGKLQAKYPVMQGYFNARIDILPMNDKALIEYAKKYAYSQEYKIDEEKGVLALAQRIEELQIGDHHVTTEEVEEIVDEAIAHSKRPRVSTLFDILGGKRYDYEDMIVLREKDFS